MLNFHCYHIIIIQMGFNDNLFFQENLLKYNRYFANHFIKMVRKHRTYQMYPLFLFYKKIYNFYKNK